MAIDLSAPFTIVGGKPPVAYIQNGMGYNARYEELGPCSVVGDLLENELSIVQPVIESSDDHLPEPDDMTVSERARLELEAEELGVQFRSNISTEKLRERIEEALND